MSRKTEDGLACPGCGSTELYVKDTTNSGGYVRRRRQCKDCGHRATSYEIIEQLGDPAGTKIGDIMQLRGHLMKLDPATRVLIRRLIVKLAEGGTKIPAEPPIIVPLTDSVPTQDRVPDDIPHDEEIPT